MSLSGQQLHNFIRGLDSKHNTIEKRLCIHTQVIEILVNYLIQGSPGAWTRISFIEEPKDNESWQEIRLYGSQLFNEAVPTGRAVYFEGSDRTGIQWDGGLLIPGQDGTWVPNIIVKHYIVN